MAKTDNFCALLDLEETEDRDIPTQFVENIYGIAKCRKAHIIEVLAGKADDDLHDLRDHLITEISCRFPDYTNKVPMTRTIKKKYM